MSRPGRGSARALIQGLPESQLGRAQRRENTEEKSRENRHARSEGQYPAVQTYRCGLRKAACGNSQEWPGGAPGQEQTESAAQKVGHVHAGNQKHETHTAEKEY